jgi:uncharacterized protein involved in oxidation of intracellular sulfur
MKTLIIFNHEPYNNTDIAWNGLRLADKLFELDVVVYIFLMNEAVDMAREVCKPPSGYDQDVSVCGTCMTRCGIYKNHPYFKGAEASTMQALAEWVIECDKIITF